MNVSRYRKAIAAVLTAVVALTIDLGMELPPDIEALLDPAAFAISAVLVYWLPNAPAVPNEPDMSNGTGGMAPSA